MPTTYNCTGCNAVLDTKTEHNNYFRSVCQASVSITDWTNWWQIYLS